MLAELVAESASCEFDFTEMFEYQVGSPTNKGSEDFTTFKSADTVERQFATKIVRAADVKSPLHSIGERRLLRSQHQHLGRNIAVESDLLLQLKSFGVINFNRRARAIDVELFAVTRDCKVETRSALEFVFLDQLP